ncbi:MAG: Na/Pi cotransporter family protein [Saprospiraceae bacterium]|nr:Na/Pi cotransporter family protein [Saprospiraceae bacterium]
MNGFDFWQFIAGVAVFLYAMSLIEDSLKNIAGRSFKKFLQKQSQSKFKMMLASTAITALLQSSSVVILMVLSFVGAGLIPLKAALAAALGSNLGTTLSSWLIAMIGFKINFTVLSFPLLGISLLGLLFFKRNTNLAYITSFLLGFAFLFIGLEWLKTSVGNSLELYFPFFVNLHYLLFIPLGFILTGIVQSSSLTMALSLSALYNHLIPIENAAALVIGSELGTSLKFLLASKSGIVDKRRLAWGNFLLNIFTIVMAAAILRPFLEFISNNLWIRDSLTQLVVFQTGINLCSLLVFYPMLSVFAKFLERRIKEDTQLSITKYIAKDYPVLPGDAMDLAEKEIFHFLQLTLDLNKNILGLTNVQQNGIVENIKQLASGDQIHFEEQYLKLKFMHGEIQEYLSGIQHEHLHEAEILKLAKLIQIARLILKSIKNMKDIRHNLLEFEVSANDVIYLNYQQIKKWN